MNHLKRLSSGTIWPHLLEAIERDVIQDLRRYAQGHVRDVMRGAQTPELAALSVDIYCRGMASALRIAGLDSVVRAAGDRLVHEIDPHFEAHLKARRAARSLSLNFIAELP